MRGSSSAISILDTEKPFSRFTRKHDRELRALSEPTLELDASTVRFRDGLHDREAEPAPAVAKMGTAAPREALEDARLVADSDAGAGVAHPDAHLLLAHGSPDRDRLVLERVLHGVVSEVHHRLRQALAIGEEEPLSGLVKLPPASSERTGLGEELVPDELELHPFRPEEVRLLGLGEHLQVVDDPPHSIELVQDERDRPSLIFRVLPEQLQVATADRERVAQLVARVLDEFPLAAEHRLEPVEHRIERAR